MDDVRPEASPNDPDQLVGNDTEFRPDWSQLGVPILALAADGRLLRCNRSFEAMLGLRPGRAGPGDSAFHDGVSV